MTKRELTYCFDLDGTLVTDTKDKNGKMHYSSATPIPQAINKLRKLHSEGHQILIQTARGSGSGRDYEGLTRTQLAYFEIPYHSLNIGKKPSADFYIDDKAINVNDWLKDE